jgi:hypothetical protein
MTRFGTLFVAAMLALPAAAAAEDWSVGPAPSDHPDLKAATVTNDDGHTVYLWLLSGSDADDRQLFCELHLADGTAFAGEMPVYRIDAAPAVDTADIRDAGDAQSALWAHVGEHVAFWLIASLPETAAAPDATLAPWLAGNELAVTFRAADGSEQTTRFTLAGSAQAIRAATGMARD